MRAIWGALALLLTIAACGDDSPAVDVERPTVAEFENAADCDTLNGLWVQLNAAGFWEDAELTVADVEQMLEELAADQEEVELGPTDLERAFSDRQAELGCSDISMMEAEEAASRERCQEWIDQGHSRDEDPLLFNTVRCENLSE